MQLDQLLQIAKPLNHKGNLPFTSTVTGLTVNSRGVTPGCAFVALPSVWEGKAGGEQYINQAITAGAQFIISKESVPQNLSAEKYWVQVENPHEVLSKLAKAFYPKQPQNVVAVTGTNGKSSTVDFIFQLWNQANYKCARMGTIGVQDSQNNQYAGIAGATTPDAIILHQTLQQLAENKIDYLAMESSSHALAQHRMDGVSVQVASFTNLTHDHLDYHKDAANYFQAKARLFTDLLPQTGMAVLNRDDPASTQLRELLKARSVRVITYGTHDADFSYQVDAMHEQGLDVSLSALGKQYQFNFPLIGGFQVSNAICALANAILTGVDEARAVASLSQLKSVPGRLQKVGSQVYVDYAHTPDALATALQALRPHTKGRLLVIFGCGGNRDPFKRPLMGKVASELADIIFVTDDNPRSEDATTIRQEIMRACPQGREIANREEAIMAAINELQPNDILLIAGKGHETGQIVGNQVQPFNDVTVAEQALGNME